VYVPPEFELADPQRALELIARHPFATLLTCDEEVARVSHLPLIAQERDGGIVLVGHVARGNPHAQSILAGAAATAVFTGAHAFVSASWYVEPYATVPTWNYSAVHVSGRLQQSGAWDAVLALSHAMERGPEAWDPQRLPVEYRERQLRGIVAFELRAEVIRAKAKLSQNRTEADRARVIERLSASSDQTNRECADDMRRVWR
jgi:transcriptional regulator